jgi:tetratricopeptide (TPR) repeat protein
VPGWHDATEQLQQQGKLRMVGIIQEQHPDRCRLFMQWKGMDWPLLVDAYDRLGVCVVPITLLIDEHGIVRHSVPSVSRATEQLETFLATTYEAPSKLSEPPQIPELKAMAQAARSVASAEVWTDYADALGLWAGDERLDDALVAYRRALDSDANHAPAEFRLGVTYLRRYDSERGEAEDFTRAVEHWTRALELDPNNYIWRRRIQQYGPRLDKPYPFYDWVDQARADIKARGDEPVALGVEPRGAELAAPSREFETAGPAKQPDPAGRILRDEGKFVKVEATLVPTVVQPGRTARVHLELRPNAAEEAHWNNEVGGLVVWLEPPAGWQLGRRLLAPPHPPAAVSEEPRHVEFEIRSPVEASGAVELPGYALYYVCEGVRGACLYRRQDLRVPVSVAGGAGGG